MISRTARAHPQPYRGQRPTRKSHPKLLANARFKARIIECYINRDDQDRLVLTVRTHEFPTYIFPVPRIAFERLGDMLLSYRPIDGYTYFEGSLIATKLLGKMGLFRVRVTREKGKPHWHCWFKETIQEEEENG